EAPTLADVAGTGDADDERGEDQRRNDGLDEVQEEDGERPDGDAPLRRDSAEDHAEDQADEDLRRERDFRQRHERESVTEAADEARPSTASNGFGKRCRGKEND